MGPVVSRAAACYPRIEGCDEEGVRRSTTVARAARNDRGQGEIIGLRDDTAGGERYPEPSALMPGVAAQMSSSSSQLPRVAPDRALSRGPRSWQ